MGWMSGKRRAIEERGKEKKNATEPYGCVPCHAERRHAMKKECIL